MPDRPLILLGTSRRDLRAFPDLPRTVGPGVREIRIHVGGAHRVFYVATNAEAIYVLHAFEKKTRKTAARDLQIGRDRFRQLARLRQHHGKEERD